MTDTTDAKVRRSPSPRDVNYEIEEVDDLPDVRQGSSMLEDQLSRVKTDVMGGTKRSDKFYKIGDYRVNSACTAAALQLRKRHGGEYCEGWTFVSRRQENGRSGLYVRYNPDAVIEGGWDRWNAEQAERAEKRAAAAKAREAAKNDGKGKAEAGTKDATAAKEQTTPDAKRHGQNASAKAS